MPRRSLKQILTAEFADYSLATLRHDALAAITVAAVALPLALAFGVASGATAASGLVTAILAGIVIGGLSGAPYQISGPTGAMSAILIVLAQKYGLDGVLTAGFFSGVLLFLIGVLKLGRFVAFIPAPVITGFTSGIALIIATGQLDNLLGVTTPTPNSMALKLANFFHAPIQPNGYAIATGLLVIALMACWPSRWRSACPASLIGIIALTVISELFAWPTARIGAIPQTLFLDSRLSLSSIPWNNVHQLLTPILMITALGAIESLLCGAVAANMTGIRLQANVELMAQGIGNILLPFFGGVPATAAIARTSVGIRAGGKTRLVSIFHALVILLSMFALGPVMSRIPLSALAGVLIMTAWHMNDWEEIHYYVRRRFKTALLGFAITMIATFTLDLTEAILIGTFLSAAIFIAQVAQITITVSEVDAVRLQSRGFSPPPDTANTKVAYVSGPLFFAAVGHFHEAFAKLPQKTVLVLSLRGVPLIDTSGIQAIEHLYDHLREQGGDLLLASVEPRVRAMLDRGGVTEHLGVSRFYSNAAQAIVREPPG